jgi:hypothetical protein
METLKTRWKIFIGIILDPWNLLAIVGLVLLFSVSSPGLNALTSGLISTLITFASAILGGRMTKQWVDITEGGIVIARGKAAVRSLKLLLRNTAALEARVVNFLSRKEEFEKHPEVTKRNYEEIIETCNLLEEETVSSIENWTDIVPEADIKTQIGIISELKNTLSEKESDRQKLNQQLEDAKGQSEQERTKLKDEIKKKEKQITDLTREIAERKVGLGGYGISSFATQSGIGGGVGLGVYGSKGISGITDVSHGSNLGIGLTVERPKRTE